MNIQFRIMPTVETGRDLGQPPRKAYTEDAGWDIFPTINFRISPGYRMLIPTGIAIAIPTGYYGRLAERSGLGSKGIGVAAGVIDSGYRGEIKVALYNRAFGDAPMDITTDMAIAQLIIERCDPVEMELVDDLPISERGLRGFGSSSGDRFLGKS